MKYPFFIAKRYLETKKRSRLVSRITTIAIGGVFLGVMTLVIVLSVLNGFETELRQRIISFNTNVLVFTRNPAAWQASDSLMKIIHTHEEVEASAPFIRAEAIAAYEVVPGRLTRPRGVVVKGIDLEREALVSSVIDSIKPEIDSFDASFFDDEEYHSGIVIGSDLAREMMLGFGDEVILITAPATVTTKKIDPRVHQCRVIGFFNSGMYDFDSRFIFMDIKDADTFFDFDTGLRGFGVKLRHIYEAQRVDFELQQMLPIKDYGTNNWINMNSNLFTYMKIERILLFLMLTLIIMVASFNLVGMLTMVIMEKRREIGILRSMGTPSRGIMSIFMLEGTVIGIAGTLGGLVTGWIICLILDRIQLDLPGDVYFVKTLPVLVRWDDLVIICVSAVVICFLATIYPSWEASRLLPIEAVKDD
jgi:lipoprotein-releasing system permease protein